MMRSVSSVFPNSMPGFLVSRFISNRSSRSGFFPARIVRHWRGGNLLLFDQFFRRVFRWKWRWDRFCCAVCEFIGKFFDETLCRPRASFAEGADRTASNVVPNCFQCAWVFGHSAAAQHPVSYFLHPKRTFPARCALATALMRIKLVDVVKRPNHIARVVQHDDT